MNWIVEGPWPILLTGLVLEAILLIALVRTGRGDSCGRSRGWDF